MDSVGGLLDPTLYRNMLYDNFLKSQLDLADAVLKYVAEFAKFDTDLVEAAHKAADVIIAEIICPVCEGCGQVADSDDQEPWSVWEALPSGSNLALQLGVVKPIPCPACGGKGTSSE